MALYINDNPVTLTKFPREVITNVVMALADSLKGANKITSIKLFLKKKE